MACKPAVNIPSQTTRGESDKEADRTLSLSLVVRKRTTLKALNYLLYTYYKLAANI